MPEQAGEKSFDATPHRRQQAREQGQVAYSQDLGSAAMLVVGAWVLLAWGGAVVDAAARFMEQQLAGAQPLEIDASTASIQVQSLLRRFGQPLLAHPGRARARRRHVHRHARSGLLFVPERLRPDVSRISPWAGLKRIFSLQGAARLAFGLFKLLIIAIVAGAVLYRRRLEAARVGRARRAGAGPVPGRHHAAYRAVGGRRAVGAGDPRLRLPALEVRAGPADDPPGSPRGNEEPAGRPGRDRPPPRASSGRWPCNRIGDKVPKADVVVTNPTELAVAIQYDPLTMAAPIVLAKGAGVLAQRIRRLALEHNIPVVERKPLAQLLYKEVAVNHPVPDQSYGAVAEVLAYVYQLKGKKMPAPRVA